MSSSLQTQLRAVTLATLTLAAVVFGLLNFQQRTRYVLPDDGVSWLDSPTGVKAWRLEPNSPATKAGIKPGDIIEAINGTPVDSATRVTRQLYRAGVWTQVRYTLVRDGERFETSLVTAPMPKPLFSENFLRVVGVLYLLIGLFIFARRWTAPRAVHFYVFCLVSFVLYSFHYSGKPGAFDQEVYWANVVAWLLQPALLIHFALVFAERRGRLVRLLALVYGVPAALLGLHVAAAAGTLGFWPSLGARYTLDQIEHGYLGVYFVLAAGVFWRSYRRAPSGILRQQLKWTTAGTFAGILPFLAFYILPFLLGAELRPWMNVSAFSLALLPLCFGYAIIRYRLMDVDIIFKRGLAYTAATAGVVAVYFAIVALVGELFRTAGPIGPAGTVIAIVVAAFLFQPLRDWVQLRLDHFFYRDRLDYRRTLLEFGRTLSNEVHLEPMLGSVLHRISQALLVDRLAIFLEDPSEPGCFQMGRSVGLRWAGELDLSFLNSERLGAEHGYLFFESARAALRANDAVRRTLEQLDLNYFIACRVRERTVAVLGLGKTVDGDYLTSDDLELLFTMAGYVAIAVESARLYQSLAQKAEQIERLKDFSENIVESLNVGVLALDLENRVESWNSLLEQKIGLSRDQAVGRKLGDVLAADVVAEIDSRADQEHVSSIYKFRLRNRGGQNLVVNVSIAPLVGKSGERLGRLVLIDDITDRVRLEDQMVQTDKLTSLGLLAAGVAHEVNTPLAVISNYIQMLARQMPEEDPRHTLIGKIVKQTFRASEIVNHLLNFSRTGSSEFSEVNLNAVVEETLSLVMHPFRAARITVIKTLAEPLPSVLGSTNRLQQVFLNLFMNARDAMPNGGMIEVRSAAQNSSVEVEVTDTGVGIPQEHLHRIFDPFFTTKASGRGTGLGLSVSYGIIKEHAGKIEVRSTPGKGTSFRLEFPATRNAVHV